MKRNNKCVYFHVNPIKLEVFYIGIGNKYRPYSKKERTSYWVNTVKKYGYSIIIIHDNLTIDEANTLEIKYIAQIGRKDKGLGPLLNLTDGGCGIDGYKHSKEAIAKLSKPKSEEHKNKLRAAAIGRALSEHHKSMIGQSKIGKKHSDETKEKIRKSLKERRQL